jgi:oligogalacturonide lyase
MKEGETMPIRPQHLPPTFTTTVALSLCLGLSACPVTAKAATLKGKVYPDEHKVLKAEESGFEVLQLTTNPADDSGLYFTSRSFVPDDNGLVFTSKRTGAWNLFYMNLKDFTFVQLTDSKRISGTGAEVCAATHEVFYRDGQAVKAVNLKTLIERTVTTVPEGYSVGAAVSVTADGKALAFSISENIKLTTKTDKIYSDMDERFAKRPWSAVLTGHADGSGWHEIARQKKWISHTMISPQNPDLILYCHEGRWDQVEQRMWLVNSDGSSNRALRPEEKPEISVGHEFWFEDGIHVGYQVRYPKGKPMIGVADARDGSYHEYPVPFGDGHMQASHQGNLFIGDGSEKEPYLSLYRLEDGKLTGKHIFRHGSSFSQQHWHPHPSFSPDDAYVLFTSCREGNGDVYLIKLPSAAPTN